MDILPKNTRYFAALLQCMQPILSTTNIRRMSKIVQAMLSMTGRVTMLGITRGPV
jgi:hypothetical protein